MELTDARFIDKMDWADILDTCHTLCHRRYFCERLFKCFFAAALLGILNAFFRPILIILTLPINILTMGLFTFVINAILLLMASGVIPGFDVSGFWAALGGSIIISLISWLLNMLVNPQGRIEIIRFDNSKRH